MRQTLQKYCYWLLCVTCGPLIFLTPSKLTSNLVLNPDQARSFISWILITIKHTAEIVS